MAPLPEDFAYAHYSAVYNALSFGIAAMGSAMIFVWLQIPNVSKKYRTALIINGLVTGIATYHYFRIFNSWNDAFNVMINDDNTGYNVTLSGAPFNDAYRYVDWLLTVPLLLIELVLVMGLSPEETASKAWTLGVASAAMVALGYPGEVQNGPGARLQWWAFAMFPFAYVVYTLAVGLEEATQKMEPQIASVVRAARWLTIISWLTYPCVYLIKTGLPGPTPTAEEQVGYSIADVVAKAVFGIMIWKVADTKTYVEEQGALLA
jgi:bacteriorhodopsin